jgi:hypothetical protein
MGGAVLNCPACGWKVRLPAATCPKCQANLRTGERPEVYVPLWRRKKSKLFFLIILLCLPPSLYAALSSYAEEGGAAWIRMRLGACAEPMEKWEQFSQEEFEKEVKSGFSLWSRPGENTRVAGQSAKGPETEAEKARTRSQKFIDRDNQTYFATTLMSPGPSKNLAPKENWFGLMSGEWDVAYIVGAGTRDEVLVAGEWTFAWINNGQAMQDVLSVPYQWSEPAAGVAPIQMTTIRMPNAQRQNWEGFHVLDGRMIYFGVARTASNQIMEHYQLEGEPLVAWTYYDLEMASFKVAISQSANNGASWTKVADIWAKRRSTVMP